MGDLNKTFEYSVFLKSKSDLQIRDNAIEAARQCSTRVLAEQVGKNGWMMKVRVYPHHILRENPLASGAGADRMSTGMARPFGKAIGIAAQIHKGQPIFQVDVNKAHLSIAKESLRRAATKIPCSCTITFVENKKK
jgi:large subunit ribosomal protein L10e